MTTNTAHMQEILDDFALFDDWEDKYAYIIDLGRKLEPMPDADKTEANKVHGCTSQVWLLHEVKDGAHIYQGDSDAMIVKGLVALLLKIYSGQSSQIIQSIEIEPFFEQLGLKQYLTPNRSNGFFAMVKRIRELAT